MESREHLMHEKRVLIFAGPNGAGKTAFATEFLPKEADCLTFVNADLMAAGLNPFQPDLATRRAGRLMVSIIDEYVMQGQSFAFETTLSGADHAAKIPLWREWGYWTKIYFLKLPEAELAIARVKQRTKEGGHGVPDETVRRRFHVGWRNFERTYRQRVDEWVVYDNLGPAPLLLLRKGMIEGVPKDAEEPMDADDAGALAALGRASVEARRRALEISGSVATWRDGTIVYESDAKLLFPGGTDA